MTKREIVASFPEITSCHPKMVEAAIQAINHFSGVYGVTPNDVFPTPNGKISMDWFLIDGIILRIEVHDEQSGEKMISFPNHDPIFEQVTWEKVMKCRK